MVFDGNGRRLGSLEDGSAEAAAIDRELQSILDPQILSQARLRIYSTLDPDLQKHARAVVVSAAATAEELPVALVAVENATGAIRAFAGSAKIPVWQATAMRAQAGACSTWASGGVKSTPHLVARVCSENGDLLYRASEDPTPALPAQEAWRITERFQDQLRPILLQHGCNLPAAGDAQGAETMYDASFTAATSALTCCVWVAPARAETLLARGHVQSVALPAWLRFMPCVSPQTYPAVAFQPPVESASEEIPLVRRAFTVQRESEVRRALPVTPTVAFGGLASSETPAALREEQPLVVRPTAADPVLAAQQALVTRPVGIDEGPVSTGHGFVVFPRSVRREAITWSR